MLFILIPAFLIYTALVWVAGFDQGHRAAIHEMMVKKINDLK